MFDDGRLLLIKRGNPPNKGLWAVPGGKVAWGEAIRDALRREIKEETGLDIDVGDVAWVGESIGPGNPAEWHYCLMDFYAYRTDGDAQPADDAADLGWFTLEEARKLALTSTMPALLDALESAERGVRSAEQGETRHPPPTIHNHD